MGKLRLFEIFPTQQSLLIFVLYILFFVAQGLLVTASQTSENKYDYSIVLVVLFTEFVKLLISALLYCKDNEVSTLLSSVIKNQDILLNYLVPSLLYCIYNNLAFSNLATFGPTTYYLLLQLRVVFTGVLFQVIFSKTISQKQWISLIILTFGCMLQQINFTEGINNTIKLDIGIHGLLILIQIFCSCLAGVYNEYLLKKQGADVNIFIQNIFMYIDSIICNFILLLFTENLNTVFQMSNFVKIMHFKVLLVVFNNAAIGIVTSFFLKNLNSILKSFASALELIITPICTLIFFSTPIYLNTVLATGTVVFAVYLYSQNPVTNTKTENLVKIKEEVLMQKV